MIGKYHENLIIFSKGYTIKDYFNNEFFEIQNGNIYIKMRAYGLKNNEIEQLNPGKYKINDLKKIVFTEHLNKEKFLNDLMYDNQKFVYIAQIDIDFNCKKFKTKFSSFKEAEEFIKKFINSEKFVLVFNELFINAYEHGNLGLSFEKKEELMKNDEYFDFLKKEIDKQIEVCIGVKDNYLFVKITDEGEGFELKNNKSLFNGRGIELCKKYVNIFYNKKGNSVLFIGKIDGLQTTDYSLCRR